MTRPWCFNRPAPTGYWFLQPARHDRPKPVLRFRHHAMSVDCKAHDNPVATVNGRPVTAPELSGWECRGVGCLFLSSQEIPVQANDAATQAASALMQDALREVMRMADAAKEPCGTGPESPEAIRNGRFASIAYIAAQGLGMVGGPSLQADTPVVGSWPWLRGCINGIPKRIEPIGGQSTSYVALDEVLGWLDEGERRAVAAPASPGAADEFAELDRETGRKWREDSSLETWFPITAENLVAQEHMFAAACTAIGRISSAIGLGPETDPDGVIDAIEDMQCALSAWEPAHQGYVDAFYEIAKALGIEGARVESPKWVFENEILPKLKSMMPVIREGMS